MKTQQTIISEVRLVYRTKVKASERLQVNCSRHAFDIFMENWEMNGIPVILSTLFRFKVNSLLAVRLQASTKCLKSNYWIEEINKHKETITFNYQKLIIIV